MTEEQLASLESTGALLRHVGQAMAESFNHARFHGSKTPLEPLDHCLEAEIPNLLRVHRETEGQLADALIALRASYGDSDND